MAFRRFNGGFPVVQLRGEMDRLFDEFFGPESALQRSLAPARVFPALNVWQDGENVLAEAELPGLKSEDIEISVVGSELTIKGRRPEGTEEGTSFHRRERGLGEFTRVVRLPVEVNAEKVQASLQDGVLRLTLPKAEAAKPRKIQVNAS
jgi:HSP20 family protein